MSYVTAFNRDRDFYQVPLALYEADALECLVTDLYYPDSRLLRSLPGLGGLGHRQTKGLPSSRVRWNLPALFWQVMGQRLGYHNFEVMHRAAKSLSYAALARAIAADANLFLYSEYAGPAFASPAARDRQKLLFVFHPLSEFNRWILSEDYAAHPECAWSVDNEFDMMAPQEYAARQALEWRHADRIAVASSFTRRSLEWAGCPSEKITVIPYGYDPAAISFDLASKEVDSSQRTGCRFLFVGQGLQRKGLHHLLAAWNKAALKGAELTVVASVLDPGIAAMAGPGVTFLPPQSWAQLLNLFARAHVFVMPSLIEGFGFVYLEALLAGCFVIGTPNTGLPDIAPPSTAAHLVAPGDRDMLAGALVSAYTEHRDRNLDAVGIRAFAETLTWPKFRSQIRLFAGIGL